MTGSGNFSCKFLYCSCSYGVTLPQVGRPLPWPQSLPYLRRIRHAGVRQFLHVYDRLKDIEQDELLWGDEIEYGIFKVRRPSHQRPFAGDCSCDIILPNSLPSCRVWAGCESEIRPRVSLRVRVCVGSCRAGGQGAPDNPRVAAWQRGNGAADQ